MQVATKTKRTRVQAADEDGAAVDINRFRLSFYTRAPTQTVTLSEFERLGLDRLQVLKFVENTRLTKGQQGSPYEVIDAEAKRLKLNHAERDNTSHFILRLAYCRTEEQRRWLLSQEAHLFRARFESQSPDNIQKFFHENGLDFKPLRDLDDDLYTRLVHTYMSTNRTATPEQAETTVRDGDYFKVPFLEALDLVRGRRVYVQGGFAFVPRKDLVSIVVAKFRAHLSHELATTYRASQNMRQDHRIRPLVSALSKRNVGPTYKSAAFSGAVTPAQIPMLAERSFPLCMQSMHQALVKDKHLKYGGRQTYGLFLKGIGLSLEDALEFWRNSFQLVGPDKFNREYAYSIRHRYGKEGKRTDYTPYNCAKIISNMAGAGEHHGCPFRQWDEHLMRAKLLQRQVRVGAIDEIVELIKGHHYQLACRKYFSATHGDIPGDDVGNHPNQYFAASVKYYQAVQGGLVAPSAAPSSSTSAHSATSASSSSSSSLQSAVAPSSSSSSSAASPAVDTAASTAEPAPAADAPAPAPAAAAAPAPMEVTDSPSQ